MSIVAGIYCRNMDAPQLGDGIADIRKSMSRAGRYELKEFRGAGYYAASIDVGAFKASGIVNDCEYGLTIIVGDPVLKQGRKRRFPDRGGDVEYLHRMFSDTGYSVLKQAAGTFAGIHISKDGRSGYFFTDKCGLRQLFVAVTSEYVVFASALRVLEGLSLVRKEIHLEGLIEQVELGSPLCRNTPYRNIHLIAGAEVISVAGPQVSTERYWHWPEAVQREVPLQDHVVNCFERFQDAISTRIDGDTEAAAFLSGGLDSRSIVSSLRGFGLKVNAINRAPPATQDRIFAQRFAERSGSQYLQMPFSDKLLEERSINLAVHEFLLANIEAGKLQPDRPASVWAGYGGSVGLGHVHLSAENIAALESGNFRVAARDYVGRQDLSLVRRPIRDSVYRRYRYWPETAILAEMEKYEAAEPGRAFYFFMMSNAQRRTLHQLYEEIDLHGLEFQLPFFDSDFLEAVAVVPVKECLYHRFYDRWMRNFDKSVYTTPWQSYPGHVPSPVQENFGLGYQWDDNYSREHNSHRLALRIKKATEMLMSEQFPGDLLSRPTVQAARLLALGGSQRLGYAIDKAYQYFSYWRRTVC